MVLCKSHYSPIPIFEKKNNLNIITTKRKNDLDDDSEYHVEYLGDITVEKLDIGEIDSKNFENKDDISFGIISTNRKDGEFISKNFESEDNTLGIIFTNRIDNIKDKNSDNKKENLEIKKGGGLEKIGIFEKFIEIPPCFMETININEDDIVIKLSDSSSSENDNIKNNVNSKVILEDDSSNLNEEKENNEDNDSKNNDDEEERVFFYLQEISDILDDKMSDFYVNGRFYSEREYLIQ